MAQAYMTCKKGESSKFPNPELKKIHLFKKLEVTF